MKFCSSILLSSDRKRFQSLLGFHNQSINNQPNFSNDKSLKQLLKAALKKNPKEDKDEKQEVIVSLADAKYISVGAAIAAGLAKLDFFFHNNTEGFCFCPVWLWKEFS